MKRQRESREEKMSQIQGRLLNSTREIFESEQYAEYIATMAKFPNYSINNCILIASQCPSASYVCGYKKWQTEFNRTVNRNEHGIMIIAPIKIKADVVEPVYDNDQHPVLDTDGNQKKEKVTREFQGFRPAYVFDLQQTSGDPLPTLVTLLDADVDGYEQLKAVLEKVSPVPITFEEISGGANGYFSPSEQRIVVKNDLSELQTVKTMIHEIAHASLEHGSKEDQTDRNCKEVQAESVAFWVTSMLNLDTSDYSFRYIASWSKDKEATELKESLEIIKSIADKISSDIENELLAVKEAKIEQAEEEAVAAVEKEQVRKKVR